MEEFSDDFASIGEDFGKLAKVKKFLKFGTGSCSITYKTIETFKGILGGFSSQETPDIHTIETLLDSFLYLTETNKDNALWNEFGFQLGVLCVKILSAIERMETFEILFLKLLIVLGRISQHNVEVWKAVSRQILNVLINKKFSFSDFEKLIKAYISVLKKIDGVALNNFAVQNLHLLKTLSMLVPSLGDFYVQLDIMTLLLLHVTDKDILNHFFEETSKEINRLFKNLEFSDFEGDCRIFLNALNQLGIERRVFSICCDTLNFGGCFVEPPKGRHVVWLDGNKTSERMSIKCADFENPEVHQIIHISFLDLISVRVEKNQGELYRVMIKAKNLEKLHKDVKNSDVNGTALCGDNTDTEIRSFVEFLEETIKKFEKKRNKMGKKLSQTLESIFINREEPKMSQLQDSMVSSSVNKLNLSQNFIKSERFSQGSIKSENSFRENVSQKLLGVENPLEIKLPKKNIVSESQDLSPNSFVETLNKNLDSFEFNRSFEDSLKTVEFFEGASKKKNHQLFRSSQEFFFVEEEKKLDKKEINFSPKKEFNVPSVVLKQKARELRVRRPTQRKLFSLESQDYFHRESSNPGKKKPTLPKLKSNKRWQLANVKSTANVNIENKTTTVIADTSKLNHSITSNVSKRTKTATKDTNRLNQSVTSNSETYKRFCTPIKKVINKSKQSPKNIKTYKRTRLASKSENKLNHSTSSNNGINKKAKKVDTTNNTKQTATFKPSLLDPNGYGFQKWIQPTTSKRGSFWLEKINQLQEKKKESAQGFDFSDNSDVDLKEKRKSVKCRKSLTKRTKTQQTKQMNLKHIKEALKTTEWKKIKSQSDSSSNNNCNIYNKSVSSGSKNNFCKSICKSSFNKNSGSINNSKNSNSNNRKAEEPDIVKEESKFQFSSKNKREENKMTMRTETAYQKSSPTQMESPLKENAIDEEINKLCEPQSPWSEYTEKTNLEEISDEEYQIVEERREFDDDENKQEKNDEEQQNNEEGEEEESDENNNEGKTSTEEEKLRKKGKKHRNDYEEEEDDDGEEDGDDEEKSNEREEDDENEPSSLSESEKPNISKPTKRGLTDDENSITKKITKKKPKTNEGKPVPLFIRSRLEKAKEETNEIIETVQKAANHILNHFERKRKQKFGLYLKAAEEAVGKIQESDDFEMQEVRLRKLSNFYKNKCSASKMCLEANEKLEAVLDAALCGLESQPENEASQKISRFNNRLKSLIESEIDKSIENELKEKKNKIKQCLAAFRIV